MRHSIRLVLPLKQRALCSAIGGVGGEVISDGWRYNLSEGHVAGIAAIAGIYGRQSAIAA